MTVSHWVCFCLGGFTSAALLSVHFGRSVRYLKEAHKRTVAARTEGIAIGKVIGAQLMADAVREQLSQNAAERNGTTTTQPK